MNRLGRWPQDDFYLATFFCQSCGQPIKLDSSLLDHRSVEDALAPLPPLAGQGPQLQPQPQGPPGLRIHTASPESPRPGGSAGSPRSPARLARPAVGVSGWSRSSGPLRRPSFPSPRPQPAAADGTPGGLAIHTIPPSPTPPSPTPEAADVRSAQPQASQIQDSFVVLPRAEHAGAGRLAQTPAATALPTATGTARGSEAAHEDGGLAPPAGSGSPRAAAAARRAEDHRGNLSHRLKVASKLFDMISGASTTDHPLCIECADELVMKLEKHLGEARSERDSYAGFLATLDDQMRRGVGQIEQLRKREESAMASLRELERENEDLQREIALAEADLKATDEMEQSYWQDVNDLERELANYQNQLESINLKYDQAAKKLDVLSKTNVYSDAFRIWHDGPFGTINGLRLGRLPNHPVEWSEINAAMGQTVLLLDTLSSKLNFTFANYRLVPMGSFSRIERIDGDKSVYELYGSSDIAGVLFWNRRFDFGLIAFLNCLQQLGDFAEQQDTRFRLPYRINKDRIGDASIRLQFSQDESWTKALKYTLINVKWMLAFCCSRLEPA
ncbi:Vacuolar protein sorting-associated protein atg6 [Polyrhizophydium stewartii]|uniref:Vacuolar protein sorting-associated protein atg6 n=1 Tax=Polyrhizophydium stewartii TaxID=2732419 RepID=A0ABR4NGP2_9FUNG